MQCIICNAHSAETNDDYNPDEESTADVIPKSDAEKAAIRAGLAKNEIFSMCTDDQLDFLVKGFTELGVETGEVVISQGEPGDHFYVVASGKFVVRSPTRMPRAPMLRTSFPQSPLREL